MTFGGKGARGGVLQQKHSEVFRTISSGAVKKIKCSIGTSPCSQVFVSRKELKKRKERKKTNGLWLQCSPNVAISLSGLCELCGLCVNPTRRIMGSLLTKHQLLCVVKGLKVVREQSLRFICSLVFEMQRKFRREQCHQRRNR